MRFAQEFLLRSRGETDLGPNGSTMNSLARRMLRHWGDRVCLLKSGSASKSVAGPPLGSRLALDLNQTAA